MSQVTEGTAMQRAIEKRAERGEPVCPNGCGLRYDPVLGHLSPGKGVTPEEEACLRLVAAQRDGERSAQREATRLVELGQQRRHLAVFWCSLLMLAVLLALMVAASDGPTITSSTSVEVAP